MNKDFNKKISKILIFGIIILIVCAGISVWIWQKNYRLLNAEQILLESFNNFRGVDSFHYIEERINEGKKSNGELGYLSIQKLEGFFSFPDKAIITLDSINLRKMDGKSYTENDAPKDSGESIIIADTFYNKAQDITAPAFVDLSYLVNNKYYETPLNQLEADSTETLIAFKWLREEFNLNNPNMIKEIGYMTSDTLNEIKYYKIQINSFYLKNYIEYWEKSGTEIRNLFEGYDIEELYEGYEIDNVRGFIWIDKETLLPYKIVFEFSFSHMNDGVDYLQMLRREIVFDRYNDSLNLSKIPTNPDIIDEEEYNMLFQKRIKELKKNKDL